MAQKFAGNPFHHVNDSFVRNTWPFLCAAKERGGSVPLQALKIVIEGDTRRKILFEAVVKRGSVVAEIGKGRRSLLHDLTGRVGLDLFRRLIISSRCLVFSQHLYLLRRFVDFLGIAKRRPRTTF